MSRLIVINGVSSSGKTCLVNSFVGKAPQRYHKFHIDKFTETMPKGLWETRVNSDAGWDEIAKDFNLHLKQAYDILEFVIADTFYKNPNPRSHLFETIGRSNIYYVELFCELDELERRERQRHNRRPGLARSQFSSFYDFDGYDLRIDSTRRSIEVCAQDLIDKVSNNRLHRVHEARSGGEKA